MWVRRVMDASKDAGLVFLSAGSVAMVVSVVRAEPWRKHESRRSARTGRERISVVVEHDGDRQPIGTDHEAMRRGRRRLSAFVHHTQPDGVPTPRPSWGWQTAQR